MILPLLSEVLHFDIILLRHLQHHLLLDVVVLHGAGDHQLGMLIDLRVVDAEPLHQRSHERILALLHLGELLLDIVQLVEVPVVELVQEDVDLVHL